MLLTKLTKIVLFWLVGLLAADIAFAQASYKFTEIKTPHETATNLFGINDAGVMSGNYTDSGGVSHCFIRMRSTVTTIVDPNENTGGGTQCYGINNGGAIVGGYSAGNFSNGFLHLNGVFSDIIPPTSVGTTAYGVNDAGWVVGTFIDNVAQHGFVYDGSTYTTLDAPGTTNGATLAIAINSSNLITVQAYNSSGALTSYLFDGTNWSPLSVPNAVSTAVHQINNRGEIAISWYDSGNVAHGAILADGVYYVNDDPSGTNTTIHGINNKNEIVGSYLPAGASQLQGYKGLNTPTILSFSPPSGPVGTRVTINGTGFTQTTRVSFGGRNDATFTVDSDSKVTATVRTNSRSGEIKVSTPAGVATSATSFTVD